ncbi:DUF2663 family protein [Virgibacillus flavescens]|uniref:DUF2663 family protein n=1 Tax=Virgibacillus flavescens TaxID=1611422 RepID=UPI003D327DE0
MERLKNRVTNDTYKMLESLIYLKENINELTRKQSNYLLLAIVSVAMLIVAILYFIRIHPSGNILFITSDFFGDFYRIMLTVISVTLCLKYVNCKKEIDKAKANLEELRLESITHLKSSWHLNDNSKLRDEISEVMEEHGINVRFKFDKKIPLNPASDLPNKQPASSDYEYRSTYKHDSHSPE